MQCVCEYPGCVFPAYRLRQRTAYHDEEQNYATLCVEHHAEADEYWRERWHEYYSDISGDLYA